jgi:peptidyl-prolyl cis-trans isomerase A (cyclophilin A)
MRVQALLFAVLLVQLTACEAAKNRLAESKPDAAIDPNADPLGGQFDLAQATAGLAGTGTITATIETSMGTLVAKLYDQDAPVTVANFIGLARGVRPFRDVKTGAWVKRPFYDGLTFHRVIKDFMIQSGDPLATSRGGPGYKFADELSEKRKHDRPGILSMANAGPVDRATGKKGTNGSQFFITEIPTPHLDLHHAVFGELLQGLEVVKKIAQVPVGPENKPIEDVVIKKITIQRQ